MLKILTVKLQENWGAANHVYGLFPMLTQRQLPYQRLLGIRPRRAYNNTGFRLCSLLEDNIALFSTKFLDLHDFIPLYSQLRAFVQLTAFISLHLSKTAVAAVEAFDIFTESVNGFKVFHLSKEYKNSYYKGFNSKKTQVFNEDLKRLLI